MSLYEKYRPDSWSAVIGQTRIVQTIARARERNEIGGNAFWISGKSGQGKTTIARLLAREIADDFSIEELDASYLTGPRIDKIESGWTIRGFGAKAGRAFIINEAHLLRGEAVGKLLTVLERIPKHVVVIFTTTCDGQAKFEGWDDSAPFLSRCIPLNICLKCQAKLEAAGKWPHDQNGQECCQVSKGQHKGECQVCTTTTPDSDLNIW